MPSTEPESSWEAAVDEPHRVYFERRAAEEEKAAEQAGNAEAASIHRVLADKYARLAAAVGGEERPPEPKPELMPEPTPEGGS